MHPFLVLAVVYFQTRIIPPVVFGQPQIFYSFCYSKTSKSSTEGGHCEGERLISSSKFKFGDLFTGFLNVDDTRIIPFEVKELVLRCQDSWPIRWLARKPLGSMKNMLAKKKAYVNSTETDLNFEQRVAVNLKALHFSRVLRCERFVNHKIAAELYLHTPNDFARMFDTTDETQPRTLHWYLIDMSTWMEDKETIVPCVAQSLSGHIAYTQPNLKSDSFDYFILITRARLGHVGNIQSVIQSDHLTYDPRLGYKIKDEYIHSSVYECQLRFPAYIEIVTPVLSLKKAILYLRPDDEGEFWVHCDAGSYSKDVRIQFGPCRTLLDCELLWRPLEPILFSQFPNDVTIERPQTLIPKEQGVFPGYYHGFVQCLGIFNHSSKPELLQVVSTMDYMFTDLDDKPRLLSKNISEAKIMKFELDGSIAWQPTNNTFTFWCTMSTFLLTSYIDFLIEYKPDVKKSVVILKSDDKSLPLGAIMRKEPDNDLNTRRAIASWSLELPFDDSISRIICRAFPVNRRAPEEISLPLNYFLPADDPGTLFSDTNLAIIISIAVVFICTTTIILAVLWRKYVRAMSDIRRLTDDEVDEFHFGTSRTTIDEDGNVNVDGVAFDPEKRIETADLIICPEEVLGEGQFGVVYKGHFENYIVAVKSPKSNADNEYFKAFLKEIKVMAFIGEHEHIVKFLGAVVDKIRDGEAHAVMELSYYGNLNKYLRKHADKFSDFPEDIQMIKDVLGMAYYNEEPIIQLNSIVLYSFCGQIATGINFLAERKVIHGDLATRNVLVFDNNIVKITDFGLARQLYNCAEYTRNKHTPVPWRWMSVEALRFNRHSTKSDVWSFGVTLWEIFSLGEIPFSGIAWSTDFSKQLMEGLRLNKPHLASNVVFEWMMQCWLNDPESRPSFTDCKDFFINLKSRQSKRVTIQ